MKKLLSIALCAAAITSFADETQAETTTTETTDLSFQVSVIPVTLPAGQTNTIIAAAFDKLTGGDVDVANFVKTTNLAAGDQLLLFKNGSYTAWVLDSDKKWAKTTSTFTLGADGNVTVGTGTETSQTLTAGSGLWIIRKDAKDAATIAIFGATSDNDADSYALSAKAWNLVGNASIKDLTFTDGNAPAAGDRCVLVESGKLVEYTYVSDKGWSYQTTEEVDVSVLNTKVLKQTVSYKSVADFKIAPGVGFWYYTESSNKKISF